MYSILVFRNFYVKDDKWTQSQDICIQSYSNEFSLYVT
jgi:hypothetical protein